MILNAAPLRCMLPRRDSNGLMVITQPAHALLSGQLARAWGNEAFGDFAPREEVCLAAALHDIGWVQWELAPSLNSETGLPHTFRELPTNEHVAIWSGAGPTVAVLDTYAGLLVSLHGTGLFARVRDPGRESPQGRRIVDQFMSEQAALQRQWIDALRTDPIRAQFCDDQVIQRNRRLIAVWDLMSLRICTGFDGVAEIDQVPAHHGSIRLGMRVRDASKNIIDVDPWPFRESQVTIKFEGRRLEGRFDDERAMQRALSEAVPIAIAMQLVPAT